MQVCSRDLTTSRLVRKTLQAPTLPEDSHPIMANHISLQDKFFPIRTTLHSCIQLPETNGNNFELKSQIINTLPKFHGMESEDVYFFIRKFEEVCLLMIIPQLGEDAVRLWFILFALKELAKKWLYSLTVGSISSWNDFLKVFLKNFTQSIRPLSSRKISSV